MRMLRLLVFLLTATALGCQAPLGDSKKGDCNISIAHTNPGNPTSSLAAAAGTGALLATRFSSLEELKSVVQIDYQTATGRPVAEGQNPSQVQLIHCSNGHEVVGVLEAGISQGQIMDAQKGSVFARMGLIFKTPYAISNRADLQRVYTLARRFPNLYGEGDPAFFSIAETTVAHINTVDLAFWHTQDTTEKGYLNTFNHITAQAFISSFFSEEMADFVADVHERQNMPELVTGKFTAEQLVNPDNNPMDNYVDIINNEWGQELGLQLKEKYGISRETWWTPELLANYLNDMQTYYTWAFQIGFRPFRPEDELVVRFAKKINYVMANAPK